MWKNIFRCFFNSCFFGIAKTVTTVSFNTDCLSEKIKHVGSRGKNASAFNRERPISGCAQLKWNLATRGLWREIRFWNPRTVNDGKLFSLYPNHFIKRVLSIRIFWNGKTSGNLFWPRISELIASLSYTQYVSFTTTSISDKGRQLVF